MSGLWASLNIGFAALLGAAGVALAAVAAHRTADPSLATAALYLILHGTAAIGLTAVAGSAGWPQVMLASASLMIVAVMLFSGDVASRVLLGDKLFAMAAPAGGSLLILAWIIAAIAALLGVVRSG